MTDRTCTLDGCARAHYAHDLCVTHYRAQRRAAGIDAKRSRFTEQRTCECCGVPYTARYAEQRYCDRTCRDIANLLTGQQAAASTGGLIARAAANICLIQSQSCLTCGALFTGRRGRRPTMYCQPACRPSAHRAHGYRKHAAQVHERDSWACWLCGKPTATLWTANNPLAPTLDHLIPVSLGGTDDPGNLGTAHAICNSLRGARMITDIVLVA